MNVHVYVHVRVIDLFTTIWVIFGNVSHPIIFGWVNQYECYLFTNVVSRLSNGTGKLTYGFWKCAVFVMVRLLEQYLGNVDTQFGTIWLIVNTSNPIMKYSTNHIVQNTSAHKFGLIIKKCIQACALLNTISVHVIWFPNY